MSNPTISLGDVALINPENLSAATPADTKFRYIDLGSVNRGVINWSDVANTTFAYAPSRARRVTQAGDVLFGTVRPALESHASIPSDATRGEFIASTGFAVIRAKANAADSRFLHHYLFSQIVRDEARRAEVGSNYPAVNESDIRRFAFPKFSFAEQRRIADILDAVDDEISTTKRIIAKLQKAKRGLLRDLLSNGVDKNGMRRDPLQTPDQFEVSRLGVLPKGWKISSIAEVCSLIVDCPHSTPKFLESGVFVARTTNIRHGIFMSNSASYVSEAEYIERISRAKPSTGDLILTREAPVGEAFIVPQGMQICLGQRVMLLRPRAGVLDSEYLLAQLYSGRVRERIDVLTAGTTNPHINVAEVKRFQLPVPSFDEQIRISEVVQAHDARARAESSRLDKLEKLKTGLMSDLLTGRVRVPLEAAS
ncbi:restriction endonuclease subunit S (plasmid) [Mycobacterium sp. TJFP1]